MMATATQYAHPRPQRFVPVATRLQRAVDEGRYVHAADEGVPVESHKSAATSLSPLYGGGVIGRDGRLQAMCPRVGSHGQGPYSDDSLSFGGVSGANFLERSVQQKQ